jgi:hypothetical protein
MGGSSLAGVVVARAFVDAIRLARVAAAAS